MSPRAIFCVICGRAADKMWTIGLGGKTSTAATCKVHGDPVLAAFEKGQFMDEGETKSRRRGPNKIKLLQTLDWTPPEER